MDAPDTPTASQRRTDAGSRLIRASPDTVYAALVDPGAVASWRPPAGMTGQVHVWEPWPGGSYRVSLRYDTSDHPAPGRTSADENLMEHLILNRLGPKVWKESAFVGIESLFHDVVTIQAPDPGKMLRLIRSSKSNRCLDLHKKTPVRQPYS